MATVKDERNHIRLRDGCYQLRVNGMKKCKHTPHLCLILRPERHGFIFIFCGMLLSVGPTLPLHYITLQSAQFSDYENIDTVKIQTILKTLADLLSSFI